MEAKKIRILDFIGKGKKTFNIPVYQRNYDWQEENCKKLFTDIENIIKHNEEIEHFLGTVVYVLTKIERDYEEYVLIDGQQRITSISLLLKALHEKIISEDTKESIWEQYLINKKSPDNIRIRLKPIESDSVSYKQLIDNNDDSLNSNVCRNYKIFKELLENSHYSAEQIYSALYKIELVTIKLEKDKKSENPQLIFESLNSTGLSLTQADLIRNYLLMNSEYEKQTVLYKNFWLKIEIELTNKKISDFIRDFLTMKTGKIANKNKVYDDFKEYMRIQKELNEEAVLEELVTYSKYYNWFLNANSNNEKINEKLKHFKYLKNTTVYPLLLSIFEDTYYYKKLDEDKLLKIIDLLISYIFRRTICGYKTSSINKVFASIPKKILENQDEKDIYFKIEKNLMERRLETIFPRNEEFKINFIKYNFEKNKELLKYTLKELEEQISNNVINDVSNLNIEYIMPENLNSEWKLELGEKKFENTHLEYLGTIGNSSLIENELLRYNKNFKTKKEFYKKSNIEITKNIDDYQIWTDNEIKNRAEQLYEKSKEIWSIPAGYKIQKLNNIEYGKEYLLNSSINVTGEKPDKLIIDGIPYPVKSWKGLLEKLCIVLYDFDSDTFKELIYNPNFQTKERVILSNSTFKLRQPIEISNDLYIESNLNANAILSYADIIASNFELSDEIYFVLKRK
ncbi:DUF262 domain-containing protein [Leptotrichia buccalis]|uniref:DUF262 domain-containing protein n=1 Tax=Leptotrichia buccalis (strain ATCC 14201 / DSM 1135 / JCM 12969 / NCTC 10249 / C-1013-b) TaxID=523794 RepID=C7NEC2_LEPBD|nr:DUF262 domain-containing protein [Leptotrichia buccalis]ACV38317.1 protein of unknown function DUF262 [Leptotrichia buccalis C-1013-b]